MPDKPLDPDLLTAIRQITDRFILSREATPVHTAKSELGRKHNLLDEAERRGYLKRIGPNYFPAFRALRFADDEDRAAAEQCTTLVFRVLKRIYEQSGETTCPPDTILQVARTIAPATADCIAVGMLFATEFTTLVPNWGASPDNESLVLTLPTSARLLDFEDLQSSWEQQESGELNPQMNVPGIEQSEVRPQYGGWEVIEPLGGGGQSDVFLARAPVRVAMRKTCLREIRTALRDDKTGEFATAIWNYARPDSSLELGALKVFKIREGGAPAEERLKREIAVLRENRPRLPRLLDASAAEQWMVTEYFPGGTLAKHPTKYKGQSILALRAFRTLVDTVATSLHSDKIVHRDLKPANIFIGDDGNLIPGDFGIVFLPNSQIRPTQTDERVGPWESMPQWADLGSRLKDVNPSFDVYMLGKLLWCMISGVARLPREYHRWAEFDLAGMFPEDEHMHLINKVLDKCLVDRPERCLPTAKELLAVVDESLGTIADEVPILEENGQLKLRCRACGKGFYRDQKLQIRPQSVDPKNMPSNQLLMQVFVCDVCTHYAFFGPGYPAEAQGRGWKRWGT